MDYTKFDEMINGAELAKEVKELDANGGRGDAAPEIPDDTYEATLKRLELVENKKGLPMVKVAFAILKGKYKGLWTWNNYNVSFPQAMHNLHELLRSMQTDTDIEYHGNFADYADMLADVLEEVGGKVGFALVQGSDSKGFKTFKIEDDWDLD